MSNKMETLPKSQEGATAVEYGLIVGLIVVAIAVVVGTLGTTLKGTFNTVITALGAG
jgi:pilus assembly protein Flp/PilA